MSDYKMISRGNWHGVDYQHVSSKCSKETVHSPHTHNSYEILLFVRGRAHYTVEGAKYNLSPMDMMVMRNNELHNITQYADAEYERVVINIRLDFFERYGCEEYRSIFEDRLAGRGNLISSSVINKHKLYDIIKRMEKYNDEKGDDAVKSSCLIELLYLLNKYGKTAEYKKAEINITVEKIINYINENLSEKLSLDEISEKLFLSKYHLCRVFREHTGYTINRYVAYKRILSVKKLCFEGKSLTEASELSGFESYSNFYKTYTKTMGCSPKEGIFRR
ncbi:MAG: helix-turn-helix transcriptional regulator [Clostridia bacterium]|nr:helix-turn-helix transcriptional regulator [Clostridia bacterium]